MKRLKGESRPVNGEISRAKVLSALEAVDAVVIFGEDTPAELLSRLRPDVLAKGGDYRRRMSPGANMPAKSSSYR